MLSYLSRVLTSGSGLAFANASCARLAGRVSSVDTLYNTQECTRRFARGESQRVDCAQIEIARALTALAGVLPRDRQAAPWVV